MLGLVKVSQGKWGSCSSMVVTNHTDDIFLNFFFLFCYFSVTNVVSSCNFVGQLYSEILLLMQGIGAENEISFVSVSFIGLSINHFLGLATV